MLVEPGTEYTRAAFSIKSCGMIWRMTKKDNIQTFGEKYISMFYRPE